MELYFEMRVNGEQRKISFEEIRAAVGFYLCYLKPNKQHLSLSEMRMAFDLYTSYIRNTFTIKELSEGLEYVKAHLPDGQEKITLEELESGWYMAKLTKEIEDYETKHSS